MELYGNYKQVQDSHAIFIVLIFQIPAFYSVGRQGNKKATGFSEKLWPINGGEWAPASCSYSEIILTG